jgi:hypothetical protein
MERPWSWLFFIDAEHIAAEKMVFDLASASSRCRCTVPSFPDFGNSLATFSSSFTQSDYSTHAAIAFPRSKGVSRASYSRITRPAEGSSHSSERLSDRPCEDAAPVSEKIV